MDFHFIILLSVSVGIVSAARSAFTDARDEIFSELHDMCGKINQDFNYPSFLKDDKEVTKIVRNSNVCVLAIRSLRDLVHDYKSASDIKEDDLKAGAKEAYNECKILISDLNALAVNKQITETNQKLLKNYLQYVMDTLKGISVMEYVEDKIYKLGSNILANLSKFQIGKKFTEEKNEVFRKALIHFLLDNLKEVENEQDLPIVRKIKELKTFSFSKHNSE
ncbi:hypothetical protein Ddc_12657 [Ditylenchus destructor]|nr:hypothetical protein Ddc_12657 [Ditylenchus destructor]